MSRLKEDKLIEEIQNLKGKVDERFVPDLESWEESVKSALLTQSLKNHHGIKMIITQAAGEIVAIDKELKNTYSKDLPDIKRDVLLNRKQLWEWFLNLFPNAERTLRDVEARVGETKESIE